MLSCPVNGWTLFSLEGTESQLLSYLDDIAPEWLDQAIHGLKTLQPFCVKGFLEPMRMICVVSYWSCHILVEDDDRDPLNPEEVLHEISHTSMLEFCRQLRDDIRAIWNSGSALWITMRRIWRKSGCGWNRSWQSWTL